MREGKGIKIIEWDDLDKKKFYLNGLALATSIRTFIYPLNLVKTRLQSEENTKQYSGVRDAFRKIVRTEGVAGLYRGFPISLFHVVSGQLYLTTYELSKQFLYKNQRTSLQHMCAGFTASLVSQTIMVPVDIISQHQQMRSARDLTNSSMKETPSAKLKVRTTALTHHVGQSFRIAQKIIQHEGFPGLFRGYFVSLLTYGSNSGLYWLFYYLYSERLEDALPPFNDSLREPSRIAVSGLSASLTASVMTNPLDVIRTRLQLQMKADGDVKGAGLIYRDLVAHEGYMGLTRGLYARMAQSSITSIFVILGYEYVKKLSLKEDCVDTELQLLSTSADT